MWYYNEPKSGRIASGTYKDLPCIGEGLVSGNIRCERLSTIGSFRALTAQNPDSDEPVTMECRRVYISGLYEVPVTITSNALFYERSEFYGDLFASGELVIRKSFRGEGKLQAKRIAITGPADFRGPLLGSSLKVKGALSIGDIACQEMNTCGRLTAGKIVGKDISIRFIERCHCATVQGARVHITRNDRSLFGKFLFSSWDEEYSIMTVSGDIRGDYVDLSHVQASTVIGNDVTIGPGCMIDCVRYRDHIYIDDGALVSRFEPFTGTPDNPKR